MNSRLNKSIFVAASGSRGALLVMFALWAGHAAAIDVVLHTQATPDSRTVRLGDVATIENTSQHMARRLANLPLMPTPAATHELSATSIRDFIAVLGEDVGQLRFQGAQRVTISITAAERMNRAPGRTAERIETHSASQTYTNDAVTRALTEHRSSVRQAAALRATPISHDLRLKYQAEIKRLLLHHVRQRSGDDGPWEMDLLAADNEIDQLALATSQPQIAGGTAPWTGRQKFLVDFLSDDGEVRLSIDAKVARQEAVVVASRSIEANQLITRAAVETKFVSTSGRSSRRPAVTNMDDVIGKVAKRQIRAGDVLHLDQVQAPLLVRRGDTVQAIARGGGIEVRTYAKARSDGLEGDLIEVESTESKERFFAKVVDHGQVAVLAGGAGGSVRFERKQRVVRRAADETTVR
jgi:flagella basal body P-ring formation protein FlgA